MLKRLDPRLGRRAGAQEADSVDLPRLRGLRLDSSAGQGTEACQNKQVYWPPSMTRLSDIVHSDPDILGGTPVFVGTRVPIQSLFDYLEGGETLDEFLRQFPSVKRDQAIGALDLARATLLAGARSS